MLSTFFERRRRFQADVNQEVMFFLTRHGTQAYEAILASAANPKLRTRRRRVLLAAAQRIRPKTDLIRRLGLGPRPPAPPAPAASEDTRQGAKS